MTTKRVIRIDIEFDDYMTVSARHGALEAAIAQAIDPNGLANVEVNVIYDSDDDPNYPKTEQEAKPETEGQRAAKRYLDQATKRRTDP